MMAGAGGAMRATGWRATAIGIPQFGEGASSPSLSPTRAREALMMAGAGGAMRATGWRATAIGANKAIANATALPKALHEESDSNERLRVSNWIVHRLYHYAVK